MSHIIKGSNKLQTSTQNLKKKGGGVKTVTTGLGKEQREALSVQDTKDCKVDIANLSPFIKICVWEKVNKLCFKRAKDLLQ